MNEKISVSLLVRYLKNKLDGDPNLQGVLVSGEISNFHRHNSGHLYFSLKDEKASISCVMFSSKARTLKFEPKNGDKVIVNASASIFEMSGQLQLYVNSIRQDGLGDLFQQYEELRNRLAEEGIFNVEHKKLIRTKYPERIAVLVGDKSAAMSDIKTQFTRRWPLCEVKYFPVLVQGPDAPRDIINSLLKVDEMDYDAIILARGGGSFEDLFCFNDEELIRTIYGLKTFIISGVGHEQDITLADLVADLRAPTPTASVELITPDMKDVIEYLDETADELSYLINDKLNKTEKDLKLLSENKYFTDPYLLTDKISLRMDYLNSKLDAFYKVIENRILKVDDLTNRIINYARRLDITGHEVDTFRKRLYDLLDKKIYQAEMSYRNMNDLLNAYSFENTLKRGYSVVYKGDKIINDSFMVNEKDDVRIRLYKGELKAQIKEKRHG